MNIHTNVCMYAAYMVCAVQRISAAWVVSNHCSWWRNHLRRSRWWREVGTGQPSCNLSQPAVKYHGRKLKVSIRTSGAEQPTLAIDCQPYWLAPTNSITSFSHPPRHLVRRSNDIYDRKRKQSQLLIDFRVFLFIYWSFFIRLILFVYIFFLPMISCQGRCVREE